MAKQYASLPDAGMTGGYIEVGFDPDDETATVSFKLKDSHGFSEVMQFDREEFKEWLRVVGTALCN